MYFGQLSVISYQLSAIAEVRSQKSEVRSQKSEVKLLRLLRFETFVMSAPALATAISAISYSATLSVRS
ncbi:MULTISPECIES: hypothetical protein [unclassified Moorena]|uniref:hypothetical protein n=1 Tax=unclassified Moorena TaxID=2683338 RepID=UPI00140150B9|nr:MULTISPECIES: hypothetical protein [unclassified Moorena]NEO11173.1 hypothetical protein [Moorena sp. SIO3E8]NEQ00108.1 hypothetical protein [Moorena sp. SIO3F7]